ncbi:ISL3 family transposase [Tannockella kyphosi]|uniref:ISL3 family transposase n=1 Tax=Tannockella kyphosi TaxID=2899121 RepID=UPI002012A2C8|nr:ISL3 family transposase [Tannockella kyphosi]
MYDFIINLLDLKAQDIQFIDSVVQSNHSDFLVTFKQRKQVCPHCGSITSTVKDYKTRELKHKVIIHCDTTIFYRQRRYKCNHCKKTFIEPNPFGNSRKTLTPTTIINILNDLKPYTATYSSIASKYHVSVGTVVDIFDKHVQIPRKQLTDILCWDEFYFNRHAEKKYAFMIMDFRKKYIIDIVESRWNEDLTNYFFSIPLKEREKVKYIIIDMYQNYADIAHIFFPDAVISIDPFHATKKVTDSLNSVRKRIMRSFSEDKDKLEYKLLKSRYYILLKNKDTLDFENLYYDYLLKYTTTKTALLRELLNISDVLHNAYKIKEEFIAFQDDDSTTFVSREKKEQELDSLIKKMLLSNIQEMIDCASTLKNWKVEILNSFHWIDNRRLSNGPIEGKNNYIKKIISNGNGLSNFQRARNKFIYSQNLYETYTISEHSTRIKRVGSPRGPYKKSKK